MARKPKWQRRALLGKIKSGEFHLVRDADLGPCGEGVVQYTCAPGKSRKIRGVMASTAACTGGVLVFHDPLSGRRIKSKLPVVRYEGLERSKKRAVDWVTRVAMQHGDDGLARLRRRCGAAPKKGWRK